MINSILVIIILIIIMGTFGGIINHYNDNCKCEYNLMKKRTHLCQSIILGIGAASLVPLFLNTISSDILEESVENPMNYFILAGFFLIAAISSRKFINSLSDKVIKNLKENIEESKRTLDNVNLTLEPLVYKESESEKNNKSKIIIKEKNDNENEEESKDIDPVDKVLKSFLSCRYTYRVLDGISHSTGFSEKEIYIILNKLIKKGYVREVKLNNKILYYITLDGMTKVNEKS